MTHKQCPSTVGKVSPDALTNSAGHVGGQACWRSVEEYAQTPEFREFVEREFPAGASELASNSRRDFVKLMGASLALAGAATVPGCRRPDHKIMPYSKVVPEEIIPGKPLYYATSMPLPGGGAEGLVVETHEGRPTKIEGNPLHPNNRGRCSAQALASILGMYDPDRLKLPMYENPKRGLLPATWDDFYHWGKDHFASLEAKGGQGLAVVVPARSTPAWEAAKAAVLKRFPKARWVSSHPAGSDVFNDGSRLAFGKPMREVFDCSKARVLVMLDRDLTHNEAGAIANARAIGAGRRVWKSTDSMSRIYAIEPMFTPLGMLADHHVRLAPSRISAFAVALAKAVLAHRNDAALKAALDAVSIPQEEAFDSIPTATAGKTFIELLAEDLLSPEHVGHSLIAAGASQPAEIHALVHALNAALGNVGNTVSYVEQSGDLAAPTRSGLVSLASDIASGLVQTIVCIETNPVYDAPPEADFAARYASVPNRICLSVGPSETVKASQWQLNGAHWLESWGDTVSADGTLAPIQPMIAPLYGPSLSGLEMLGYLAGDEQPDGHAMVRKAWAKAMGTRVTDGGFAAKWKRALHDGFVAGTGGNTETPKVDVARVGKALAGLKLGEAPSEQSLDVVFTTDTIGDGEYANNPWLQELPHPVTKVVWDNPIVVSPATAKALNLEPDSYTKQQLPHARMATLSVDGKTMKLPVWICPGTADNTVIVTLGYGRKDSGIVSTNAGFNTYPLRSASQAGTLRGASLKRAGSDYQISSTQNHWSLEGRTSLVRWLDKPAWEKHAAQAEASPSHGKVEDPFATSKDKSTLSVAEQLGELMHTPPNISIYKNPDNRSYGNPDPNNLDEHGNPPNYTKNPQWGMTIDLASCLGCGACMVACQSENNIPTVGKKEVAKGREMHWIRIDRYFVGDSLEEPTRVMNQPVACSQCENAPCETVCPVTATTHDHEGLNVMAYNRCIGTRYCANNCPYKSRRFNFFDWAQSKFNGGFDPKYVPPAIIEKTNNGWQGTRFNQNFIPPRLRAKLDEISKMRQNPDVTVRGRGVMEKCTYCLQRINAARADTKVAGLDGIPDGYFQVACEQACPTESIVFGDILQEDGRVAKTRTNQRSYLLLGYINTRPRTSHLMRVTNPNPAILEPVDTIALHHHSSEHEGSGEHEGNAEHEAEQSFRIDPARKADDDGYALSLSVLGPASGVHA